MTALFIADQSPDGVAFFRWQCFERVGKIGRRQALHPYRDVINRVQHLFGVVVAWREFPEYSVGDGFVCRQQSQNLQPVFGSLFYVIGYCRGHVSRIPWKENRQGFPAPSFVEDVLSIAGAL